MKIYYNCKCCNKRNTIAELIMENAWKQGDFSALDTFLTNLQANIKNKESLHLTLDEFEEEDKTLPETIKDKYVTAKKAKPTEKKKTEGDWTKWKDINKNFTEELVQEWKSYGFSFNRVYEWVNNVGLKPSEAEYASWLEREVNIEPLKYLNHTSPEDQVGLKEQFEEYKKDKDYDHE